MNASYTYVVHVTCVHVYMSGFFVINFQQMYIHVHVHAGVILSAGISSLGNC